MKRKAKKQTFVESQSGPRHFWAIMKAYTWGSLSVEGSPLTPPVEGPQRFVPIFDTHEQAVAWNNGSDVDVRQMTVGE